MVFLETYCKAATCILCGGGLWPGASMDTGITIHHFIDMSEFSILVFSTYMDRIENKRYYPTLFCAILSSSFEFMCDKKCSRY